MSAYPSLPLFTDAFIADTGHLSAQETGAYLMLMMVAWRSPDCRLADDDDRLARWARVDRRTWLRIKPTIMEFWTLDAGFWSPSRRHFGATPRTTIAPSIRRGVLSAGCCAYCGDDNGPFVVDHVVPLAKGGTSLETNLACACTPCNQSKSAHLLAEWLQ